MVYKKYSAMRFTRKGGRTIPRYTYKRRSPAAVAPSGDKITRKDRKDPLNPASGIPPLSADEELLASTEKFTYNEDDPYTNPDMEATPYELYPQNSSQLKESIAIDERMGFKRMIGSFEPGPERLGWLVNMHSTSISEPGEQGKERAALDLYFLEQDGGSFKATLVYNPYFYILCHDKPGAYDAVENYILKAYKLFVCSVDRVLKEDLSMPNHLVLPRICLLKLSFRTIQNLLAVRRTLFQCIKKNEKTDRFCRMKTVESMVFQLNTLQHDADETQVDPSAYIKELREYDIPYYIRVSIDLGIRVGSWYKIGYKDQNLILSLQTDILRRPDPVVLAFDIETTKQPLKFPESTIDSIMMISYMIDGTGFLITNRDIVSADTKPFEYTPRPDYEGLFTIYNEPNERALILRFLKHIKVAKPTVIVTYNGDYFDWPFIEDRATILGINMRKEIGFFKSSSGEYLSSYACHMDCLYWVKRDSYLPQGSHGLKTVTKAKLGYNPIEIDPEDMVRFAVENPQILSQYSVSDALSTYYLYMKYIHPFIFSLCNIIPMNPDDVLRKGSGTLCELLLMIEAYKAGVLIPNKRTSEASKFFEGHLLESETYVGGHVEALEAGIFRQDLPVSFNLPGTMIQNLLDNIDDMLKFAITAECGLNVEDILNYEEIKNSISSSLQKFKECPSFTECPHIYHFDVGAMYPNIILTNRLQPYAIVSDQFCHMCDFYNFERTNKCRKKINWLRRGDYFPPDISEYNMIVNQFKLERYFNENENLVHFDELKPDVQSAKIKERLSIYSKKVYNKVKISKVVEEESVVCQRENPFYVNAVRDFRDKRYEYKRHLKKCKEDFSKTTDPIKSNDLQNLIIIYDSLQLAHKCILNSFYGYVMRKGARWYSMEMAGIVCLIGAKIIQMARSVVEELGKPLELDTDGIWCIIPSSFPGKFTFEVKNSKPCGMFYPCTILNKMVHDRFTNHVYMNLVDKKTNTYNIKSENSIFFEVDGPYRAMILPSSSKEDKLIKKRYAVFNKDGSLAEIKGFEVKRRGELKLIKLFQSQIFSVFLEGNTIEECYKAVASVANQWLDVLYSKGACLEDSELFDLISENRSMSRSLDQYGTQKSTSISTAKRLAELLGDQMVKHKGLNCKYVICNRPFGLPVSERAIPCAVFQAKPEVKEYYLRKWLGDGKDIMDIRETLDWKYYLDRFGSVVQKIITVPASMQNIKNFVPRIPYPEWLQKKLKNAERVTNSNKLDIVSAFGEFSEKGKKTAVVKEPTDKLIDIEDQIMQPEDRKRINCVNEDREDTMEQYLNPGTPALKRKRDDFPFDPRKYSTYQNWLKDIKKKWSYVLKHREDCELRNTDGIRYGLNQSKLSWNINTFKKGSFANIRMSNGQQNHALFHTQKQNLMTMNWNIIQIRETDVPGILSLWVIVGNSLQEIKVSVKRVMYINSITNDIESLALKDEVSVKKEFHRLLSGSQAYNIYSLKVPEKFYRDNIKMFSAIYNHPNIEGVYGDSIPLPIYTLIKLGSVVRMKNKDRHIQDSLLSTGVDIDDIEPQLLLEKKLHQCPFYNFKFDMVYIFYIYFECGLYVGICRLKTNVINILVYDVNIKGKPNDDREAEYESIYASLKKLHEYSSSSADKKVSGGHKFIEYPTDLKFCVHYLGSEAETHSKTNSIVEKLTSEQSGSNILLLQSSVEISHLVSKGLKFIKKYPFIDVSLHNEYKKYQVLGLQSKITRYMLVHYLDLNRFLQLRAEVSILSDIPICDIPHDYPIFVTDILFARRMYQANIIVEWCESTADRSKNTGQNFSLYTSELKYPEVNIKGCYDTLCFELDLQDLILAPLLNTSAILDPTSFHKPISPSKQRGNFGLNSNNLTHSKDAPGDSSSNEILYHKNRPKNTDVSLAALDMLKSIVIGWAGGAREKNIHSAVLLSNIYRWFTSNTSAMNTPALHHKIFIQMRHYFMSLITEVELLGGKTIYASFDRLVIATQNSSLKLCFSSVKQIIQFIRENRMFEAVTFNLVKCWSYLVWMNPQNYGGLVINFSKELDDSKEDQDFSSSATLDVHNQDRSQPSESGDNTINSDIEHNKSTLDMFWCVAYNLHPIYRPIFIECISQFIMSVKAGASIRTNKDSSNQLEIETNKSYVSYVRAYINNNLKTKLFRTLCTLSEGTDECLTQEGSKEKLSDSLETLSSNAYQKTLVITYLCEFLGLNLDLRIDTEHLKSELFSLLGFSEFSGYAVFTNPFERLRISNYFCLFCSEVRALDINVNCCYDPSETGSKGKPVTIIVNEEPVMDNASPWRCKKCGCDYDTELIEQELIQLVKLDMLYWHLQDPICERCKSTKTEDLRESCASCSGRVKSLVTLETYHRRFKALYNLSHAISKLPILREITCSLMLYTG